jgi:hypothetical protein
MCSMCAAYCCFGAVLLAFRKAVLDNDDLNKDEGRALRAQDEQIQGAKGCERRLENDLALTMGPDMLKMLRLCNVRF